MTISVRLMQVRACLRGVKEGRMGSGLNRELQGGFLSFL